MLPICFFISNLIYVYISMFAVHMYYVHVKEATEAEGCVTWQMDAAHFICCCYYAVSLLLQI